MTNFLKSARRFATRALILPMVVLGAAACDDEGNPVTPEAKSIIELVRDTETTSTLLAAIQAADLQNTLNSEGPFTVFAPSNDAFEALGDDVIANLLAEGNVETLTSVLTFHVVAGDIRAADISDGATVTTVQGGELTFSVEGGSIAVNGQTVVNADVEATNGVIHFIDGVLTPPLDIVDQAVLNGTTGTLASVVDAAGLTETLRGDNEGNGFTVFAPVDAAFEALGSYTIDQLLANPEILTDVLTYHVVPGTVLAGDLTDGGTAGTVEGGELTFDLSGDVPQVNGVDIIATDIETTNGVIHLIDGVLLQSLDVAQRAIVTEQTATLTAAVTAADLVTTLQGDGPFTVFAPINEAFAALPGYTLDQLLDPANVDLLTEVLTYHVVPQEVFAANLTDGGTATTVEGRDLTFDLSDPQDPRVNGVSIIATDIVTENGVIHLVDEVIVPELDIVETATITEGFSTLVAAVDAADLTGTLSDPAGTFTVFAPTDAAFEALGATVGNLIANPGLLADVLTYHVLANEVGSGALSDGLTAPTVEGGELTFTADAGATNGFRVNGADITVVDIQTENGIIHVIDAVLLESLNIVERATVTDGTGTLATAVGATAGATTDVADILSSAGPYTVFAPVDAAFEALGTDRIDVLLDPANVDLLSKVLAYHAVSGEVFAADLTDGGTATTLEGSDLTFDLSGDTPQVNGVNIIATDIQTENGVIHLVDGVLTQNLDLVDVATVEGFPTLVSLVEQQGLTATLRGDNGGAGYTVFAPTEDAFAALETVPSGQALTEVLLYHVVPATVESGDLSDGQVVVTANTAGDTFTVNIDGTSVTITDGAGNTVNVLLTDVPAANGVIHVVDAVLLPPTT